MTARRKPRLRRFAAWSPPPETLSTPFAVQAAFDEYRDHYAREARAVEARQDPTIRAGVLARAAEKRTAWQQEGTS